MTLIIIKPLLLLTVTFYQLASANPGGFGLLMPLLPLATITGHGGLYASGLTSAALLKFKAATALAALAGISESGFHFKIGKGWAPDLNDDHHHHHHDNHGWGWGRKKRSVVTTNEEEVTMEEPSFEQVLSYDNLQCGMRLVCELANRNFHGDENIGEDGRLILELFGGKENHKQKPTSSLGKLTYSYATAIGAQSRDDLEACGRVYAMCPYSYGEILGALRSA